MRLRGWCRRPNGAATLSWRFISLVNLALPGSRNGDGRLGLLALNNGSTGRLSATCQSRGLFKMMVFVVVSLEAMVPKCLLLYGVPLIGVLVASP